MRFSVRFNNDLPMRVYPALARAAEVAGFDQFWVSDDLFLRGVWPILSCCALVTEQIELGTCVVNPYTIHPAEIAMQAAALDELSGERCLESWSEEAYLRFPARAIPLYLGAMSERMLRLTGALADGGLPLLFPPEHYTEVIAHIRADAAAAGRDPHELDVAACIWVSVAEDRALALDALREKIAYYGHALSDLILARLGLARADFAMI